ncbi:MAG: G1 family glutamic endopeptidase [Thermoprotei archaeon]
MQITIYLTLTLVALASLTGGVLAHAVQPISGPRISLSSSQSLNWAGYAVAVKSGEVNAAYGSWFVPTLSCTKQTTYAAFWVGIDGYNDSTVEQTGVTGDCQHGVAIYSAWYEFYPSSPVYAPASDTVKPGDKIFGSVVYNPSGNCFTTLLRDDTEGWSYTSPCTSVSGALRSSAEWITERPAVGGSLTTLANFGTAYYGYDYTYISGTNTVTINSVNYTIGDSPNPISITMVNVKGGTLAAPSPISSDGTSFSVAYKATSNMPTK